MAHALRFLRPPFKPDVRISRIRLTDGLLIGHACLQGRRNPSLRQNVTPQGSLYSMDTSLLNTLGRNVQPSLEFSHVFSGVIGSCDHALALTSLRQHDQSRVPSLVRPFDRRHRYYEPLGLPPSTIPFRLRLIGIAFARRGPPGRVSPVPYQAVWTCPPPYPVGVLHPFRFQDAVCCLRRGMSGSAYPSPFGFLSHEAARFTFRLGPPTCSPLGNLSAS